MEVLSGLYCMLNLTDLKTNKNKFYSMQIIQTKTQYHLIKRYVESAKKDKFADTTANEPVFINQWIDSNLFWKDENNNEWQQTQRYHLLLFMVNITIHMWVDLTEGKIADDATSESVSRIQGRDLSIINWNVQTKGFKTLLTPSQLCDILGSLLAVTHTLNELFYLETSTVIRLNVRQRICRWRHLTCQKSR